MRPSLNHVQPSFIPFMQRKLSLSSMAYCKIQAAGRENSVGECTGQARKPPLIWECRASASTVLSVVYDHPTITSVDDPTVAKINGFAAAGSEYAYPGNYLVEFFTWMKYIPSSIAKWKRVAEERSKKYSKMFEDMFREVEDRIVLCLVYFASPSLM